MMNQSYLNINDQERMISRFKIASDQTPLENRYFMTHGTKMSYFALLATSLVAWRTGFRGFNLYRYGRVRSLTLILAASVPGNGVLFHAVFCQTPLTSFYRSENKWKYGITSVLTHQLGALLAMTSNLCLTFVLAQRNGMIPVHKELLKDGFRQHAFRYFIDRIKPHCKVMGATFALTSAVMFFVGLQEYEDSCKVLAMMNRKSLCMKED